MEYLLGWFAWFSELILFAFCLTIEQRYQSFRFWGRTEFSKSITFGSITRLATFIQACSYDMKYFERRWIETMSLLHHFSLCSIEYIILQLDICIISRAWQNGLRAAHFGDTVLLVPKKQSPKITNWPIIQEDSRKNH